MATFVWDIAPYRYNLLITRKMAETLQRKGQEVYYIGYPGNDFMLALLKRHLNCGVVYPDDFHWLRPQLVLLDCLLVEHAPFYRERGIPYAFVAMQSPGRKTDLAADLPVLCLAPAPLPLPADENLRLSPHLLRRMRNILKSGEDFFVLGLLEVGKESPAEMDRVYRSIRRLAKRRIDYHFVLLADRPKLAERLFDLPPNVEIHRRLDWQALLPECGTALTTEHPDAWLECIFAQLPVLPLSEWNARRMTPWKLGRQLAVRRKRPEFFQKNEEEICRYFEEENKKIEQLADQLIELAERKIKEQQAP